ncbi:MAG: hypothetical protein KME42_18175 [Tildeniella nuda ZEHNDER 1965/U140]|nr:hypothetical protein [Tildeniella nuda ZEHNDER 1965/U140]
MHSTWQCDLYFGLNNKIGFASAAHWETGDKRLWNVFTRCTGVSKAKLCLGCLMAFMGIHFDEQSRSL